MQRFMSPAWVAGLVLFSFGLEVRADEKSPEEAKKFAQKLLDEGAKEFSRKDKRVMSRSYTEDAELRLISREESGGYKTESHRGRGEIEDFYGRLYESDVKPTAKNTVEVARYLTDDMIVISGTFKPDEAGAITLEFVQIRQKVDKDWLIRDMQVILTKIN